MAKAKKLKSGSWNVVVFDYKDENGKLKYRSFTAPTRKEAEFMASKFASAKKDLSSTEITLGKAVDEYISIKENILSPSTIRGYNTIRKIYITDMEGIKVKDINQRLIQQYINKYAAKYSSKTCRNIHGLISATLKIFRPEMILRTTLPAKKKRDIYVPDQQEVEQILEKAVGTSAYIPVLLATQCGLRASEISGLELKDVHDDHIEITQARVRGKDGEVIKQPKSISGYRKIPIDETIYRTLVDNAIGDRVCNLSSDHITSRWRKFRTNNKLNPSLNFHALRHHFASKCILLGIPQKYIAELMGHHDTNMIEKVYQHTFPSAMQNYANMLRQSSSELPNMKRDTKRDTA